MASPASNNRRVTRSATRAACVETTSDSYHQQCRRNRAHRLQALRTQRSINRRNSSSTSDSNTTRDLDTRRRAARAAVVAHNDSSRYASPSIVHQHFTRMRSPRHPTPFHQSPVFKGIRQFNSPIDEQPVTTFAYNDLEHHRNYVCPHCPSRLWKDERARRFNCCSNGEYAIHKLRHVPAHVWDIYDSAEFRRNQRKYNSLFAFTALAAKGLRNQTWTQPIGGSMLTMHGRAYHRIFDLQQHYAGMNVSNSSRYYIYDSEFHLQSQASAVMVILSVV